MFSEEEKVILRNLPIEYQFIMRNERGDLFIYKIKPFKLGGKWQSNSTLCYIPFKNLFQSISSFEPCEFRKYL